MRSRIPRDSPAHEAFEKATRVDHSIEGVLFEGYSLPCDENQARIILEIAGRCCPEIIPDIEKAIKLAQAESRRM
ncbi:MAG: hypothetical protein HY695_01155 [Deltaproteobacteria bacterium]|nr:hypothetical protein [Deltaproteobacteria bacterium]